MGVIRNFEQTGNTRLDEEWIYVSSDGEESTPEHDFDLGAYGRRRCQRLKKPTTKPEPTFMGLGLKGKSHKKYRRYANANFITEFGGLVNENDLEEISINDFIPQTKSPFAQLLKNMDSIGDYSLLINCTEEEQKALLGEKENIELEHCSVHLESGGTESDQVDPHRCFHRIDLATRKQLLKKHIPIGILSSIENNVIDFFTDNPGSLYKANLACSYQRFLLHACCQYFNLNCQSFTINGKRLSHIWNKKKYFKMPTKLLSEYLDIQ